MKYGNNYIYSSLESSLRSMEGKFDILEALSGYYYLFLLINGDLHTCSGKQSQTRFTILFALLTEDNLSMYMF